MDKDNNGRENIIVPPDKGDESGNIQAGAANPASTDTHGSNHDAILTDLPITALKHYSKHPFSMSSDTLAELTESISLNGVKIRIVVRRILNKEGEYEILDGHTRVEASKRAKKEYIPAEIRCADDVEVAQGNKDSLRRFKAVFWDFAVI